MLAAASAAVFALNRSAPQTVEVPPTETIAAASETPTVTAEYKPCYFVWATQELPEIQQEFQSAVQGLFPEAEARANAYGENCVAEDGSFTFGAMETDFYISVPVKDTSDDAALGEIVERVVRLVFERFPRPKVPGPMDGFVEFSFAAESGNRVIRVKLALARELLEKGLRGAELLQGLESQ